MVEGEGSLSIGSSLYKGKENARLYDVVYAMTEKEDIPFWINVAEQVKPKTILEIGVGTGRIAIPLARKGFNVVGIDTEESMLEVAQEKIVRLSRNVQSRLEFVQADARHFSLDRTFDLITVPLNTFCHFLTEEDQVAVLKNINRHLDPNRGVLVLDMFTSFPNPFQKWDSSKEGEIPVDRPPLKQYLVFDRKKQIGVLRAIRDYVDEADGHERLFIDRESRIYNLQARELFMKNRVIFEVVASDIISLVDIFSKAGFESFQLMGDYERHPMGHPLLSAFERKMIVVTGSGYRRVKTKSTSVEEAMRAKRQGLNIGLDLIIDGQKVDPQLLINSTRK